MTRYLDDGLSPRELSTRERILDAAAHVLRTKGLARATTKEIAKAVELSEAALYKHFATKSDLFLEVLATRVPGELFARFQRATEQAGTGEVGDELIALTHGMLMFFGDSFPMAASLFSDPELFAAHKEVLRERDAGPQFVREGLIAYLRAELRLGRLPEGTDVVSAADLLTGACLHHAFLSHFVPRTESVGEVAERLVAALLAGLAPAR